MSVPPVSGASETAATTAPAVATPASTAATAWRSASATIATAASRATAPHAISWSTPSSGMRKNAVASVPAMLPAVETEKSRPAVRPTRASDRARRRTAIGVTHAIATLIGPKRITDATSGLRRGPASQPTTASRTASSTNGIASTRSAASAITPSRSLVTGSRSARTPPSQ